MAKTRGVFALINDQGALLVCERADGKGWNLPGGGVAAGETDETALVREVKEETGLQVEVLEPVGPGLGFKDDTAQAFRCRAIGGTLVTTEETKSHRWLTGWAQVKDMTWAGGRTLCMVLLGLYVPPKE